MSDLFRCFPAWSLATLAVAASAAVVVLAFRLKGIRLGRTAFFFGADRK